MSRIPRLPTSAVQTRRHRRRIERLEQAGPGRWIWIGSYPTDAFTTPSSPDWENDAANAGDPYAPVAFRFDSDGRLQIDGVPDVTSFTSGDIAWTLPNEFWPAKDVSQPAVAKQGSVLIAARYVISASAGTVRIEYGDSAALPAIEGFYSKDDWDSTTSYDFTYAGWADNGGLSSSYFSFASYPDLELLEGGVYSIDLHGTVWVSEEALARTPTSEGFFEWGIQIDDAAQPFYRRYLAPPYEWTPDHFSYLPQAVTDDGAGNAVTRSTVRELDLSFHITWQTDGPPDATATLRPVAKLSPAAVIPGDATLKMYMFRQAILRVVRLTDPYIEVG